MNSHIRGQEENQIQEIELSEIRRMIEELSQAILALQQYEHVETQTEVLKEAYNPLDMPKGGLESELDEGEVDNPFKNIVHVI